MPEEKTSYALYGGLGGPQDWFWPVRKISPPPGLDPQTVQTVTIRYTDYAAPAQKGLGVLQYST